MNQNDNIESLFGQLQGAFDQAEPAAGHRDRFLARLERPAPGVVTLGRNWWRPLSIAATVLVLVTASVFLMRPDSSLEARVAKISPEVSETSSYFTSLVNQQVKELELENSPEAQPLIAATLRQLEQLESDYQKMEQDLLAGGNSKLILSAMIRNFQTRIDLLQDVMMQIEQIKLYKNETHVTQTI